jgi:hypothetical protein
LEKTTLCAELGPAQCYSTDRSNRQCPPRVWTEPGHDHPPPSAVTADRCHLPPNFHAPHMQQPTVCSASSRRPDAGPACATPVWPPATSRPTLPTSRHFRSTSRACSHRPCTLPPRPRSGREADHYSPLSYRRAPATPLEPAIATVPRPPSTTTSSAPPAPSTLPVASPELRGALQPHQPSQPQPTDHLTGAPLRPLVVTAVSPPR